MSPTPLKPLLTTYYEVYDKRSLHEPLSSLPLLDRDRDIKKALASARAWGGVIHKVQARVLEVRPRLRRTIVTSQVVFVHKALPSPPDPSDQISLKDLKGKLRRDGRVRYKFGRKR